MNDRETHLSWQDIASQRIKRCGIFDLYELKRKAQNGREGVFHLLEAPDWVNVVPVTQDERGTRCFLMVKQFRQGVSRITVEFPAGLIEAGEPPEAAAVRELYEETGYRPKILKPIGTVYPNPAFMTNRCYTFLAEDLSPDRTEEADDRADELELLDVMLVPIEVLSAEIGRGPYSNSMTAVALYWYERLDREKGADRNRTGA